MTICIDEAVAHSDETYWADNNAAEPVLLIDEATEAITEAVHQIRSGSRLDDRDVAAAGAVLGDLYGGLGQLADLLTTLVEKYSETDQLQAAQLEERLETLRATTLSARQAAEGLRLGSTGNPYPISDHQTLGLPRRESRQRCWPKSSAGWPISSSGETQQFVWPATRPVPGS